MITSLSATNYGCLQKVELTFSKLHALIGPNDSGKSTILRAIRTLSQLASSFFTINDGQWTPFHPGLPSAVDMGMTVTSSMAIEFDAGGYGLELVDQLFPGGKSGRTQLTETYRGRGDGQILVNNFRNVTEESPLQSQRPRPEWLEWLGATLGATRHLAITEEGLRRPSGFLPRRGAFLSERGEGLPGLYFMLRNDREEAFERILETTRRYFPTVRTVRAQPRSQNELELEVELHSGVRVAAAHISAGLLYFLAFVALPELVGASATILLEEPENGLHPARIREVMEIIRQITEGNHAQIVMATHSPLVINELRPEEVTVVTRPSLEEGTRVTPLRDTPNFEKRSSVYSLGELWLSYADGRAEEALLALTGR